MLATKSTLAHLLQIHEPPLECVDHCPQHGQFLARCHIGSKFGTCPTCTAEANAAKEARERQEAEREAQLRWQRQLGSSGIHEHFHDRKIGNYHVTHEGQRRARAFAEAYAEEFAGKHSGRCAVFVGQTGTDKNHLACGIAMRIMARYQRSAMFTTVSSMIMRIPEAKRFDSEMRQSEAIALFTYPSLLILDEVGVQSSTDSEARALFDVLNGRYEQRKATILLSNLDVAGVQNAIGPRLFDRLREDGGEVVPFDWAGGRGTLA
ncbi:hypothetical protein FNU76_01725 [Chitinimonas arctica]|uniref:IstB-like ATP-binding domain-containing protein n=1 Tax=Chitinimonas arctica TaxID=2594795 RepID=A0A516SAU8_9NEIS|nr:ATP-binding protein [Chitinimonas arctica]QDQ25178.1 hypothetical protein FNU76_01725 [Chitinimonas arctica]